MEISDRSSLAIGIFDSGAGGLTVLKAIKQLLPSEKIVYLGDGARLPYGNKSPETIIRYTLESSRFLSEKGIKLLIVACHTASSIALDALAEEISLPILGMVTPCLPDLLASLKNDKIAILGTQATVSSRIYQNALEGEHPASSILTIACPLFVPLVEEGLIESPMTTESIKHYLQPVKEQNITTVLLACTHYPLLQNVIQDYLGEQCRLIDPAFSCAKTAKTILESNNLLNHKPQKGSTTFYTTDDPEKFKRLGEKFLGSSIVSVEKVQLPV
ncbi:MAG: glutamate racemase [Chlamydiae bacterium]|nr:glutamate racemase [Chlamydiota bacterium]